MAERDEAEPAGFAEFVAARSRSLLRTAYLLTGDAQLAEDLVQTTLTKVYLRWARVSAHGAGPDGVRTPDPRQPGLVAPVVAGPRELMARLPERASEGHDDRVATSSTTVWNAVLGLPPRQRAVVVLRVPRGPRGGRDRPGVRMAPGTVKSTASAATHRLAVVLADIVTEPSERSRP